MSRESSALFLFSLSSISYVDHALLQPLQLVVFSYYLLNKFSLTNLQIDNNYLVEYSEKNSDQHSSVIYM